MEDQNKMMDKIKKLMALSESEKALGNFGAAVTIAEKVQELLIKFKIDHASVVVSAEPVIGYVAPVMGESIVINPFVRVNAKTVTRMQWFEELAKVVAEGYYCKAGVRETRSGIRYQTNYEIFFVGLDMDREIAIMVFLNLAERANDLCKEEMKKNLKAVGTVNFKTGIANPDVWMGDDIFIDSFHAGFRQAIADMYAAHKAEYSSSAAEDYFRKTYYYVAPNLSAPAVNDIAVEVGKNAGRFSSKKAGGSVANQAKNELIRQKVGGDDSSADQNRAGDVMVLVDVSGSMSGDKIEQAKDGALGFAESMRAKDYHVGLIAFDSDVKHRVLPSADSKQFNSHVKALRAGTSTGMAQAIRIACAYYKNHRVKRSMFIVTDGWPDDAKDALAAADAAKRMGIEIITLGCGSADEDFLKKLASKSEFGQLCSDGDLRYAMKGMAGLLGA